MFYIVLLNTLQVSDEAEQDESPASSKPVLELELAEEKLPMTLSRQEVKPNDWYVFRA